MAFTPVACSRAATNELAEHRDSDPGSFLMYFALWTMEIRGVGRVREEEFVVSPLMMRNASLRLS